MLTADAMEAAGFRVELAATPGEALGRVRASRGDYAAVLVDLKAQEADPAALVSEIRAAFADLRLVVVHHGEQSAGLTDLRFAVTILRPYNSKRLAEALSSLGVRSARTV